MKGEVEFGNDNLSNEKNDAHISITQSLLKTLVSQVSDNSFKVSKTLFYLPYSRLQDIT